MLMLMLLMLPSFDNDLAVVRHFQAPPEDAAYLTDPHGFAFAPNGVLFLVDRVNTKVFSWSPDGRFRVSWGKRGEGPGEMFRPVHLTASNDEVYVLDLRRRIYVFDHAGNWLRNLELTVQPRAFTRLGANRFCIMHLEEGIQRFSLIGEDETMHTIHSAALRYPTEIPGRRNDRPFAPEAEMQRGPDGDFYLGFSEDAILYRVNAAGKILGQRSFDLISELPTEEDIAQFKALDLYAPWRSDPRVRMLGDFDYDLPKGLYVYFLIKGDRIAFILTPTGGMWGVGTGYPEGTYTVCDFETGKRLSRGSFSFPGDSMVLFEDDRCLGIIVNPDGDREVVELALAGM